MKIQAQKNDITWWMILHFLLALSLPLILWGLVGCVQEPKLSEPNIGKQEKAEDILAVINEIFLQRDPDSLELGQAVLYETNLRVNSTDSVHLLAETLEQVIDIEKTPSLIHATVAQVDIDYTVDPPDTLISEYIISIERPTPSHLYPKVTSSLQEKQPLNHLSTLSLYPQEEEAQRITYHNLQVSQGSQSPPTLVREKENCGDVPNCQLRYTQVSYDMVLWYSQTEFKKVAVEFKFSLDTPFLGIILSQCNSSVEGPYFVRICSFLRDFLYHSQNLDEA